MSTKFNGFFEKLKIKQSDNEMVPFGEPYGAPATLNGLQPHKEEESEDSNNQKLHPEKPCLAQTLQEVIHDSTALSYLINFLEERGRLNLLKFWLHVDGLKASCGTEAKKINGFSKSVSSHTPPCKTSISKSEILRNDANNVFTTYIDAKAPQAIELPANLKISIEKSLKFLNTCENNEKFIGECFNEAHEHVWRLLENRYFKEFVHSHFYARYNLEVMRSGKLFLEDILRSHKFLCSFIEFLENEGQRQLLEFVIAVDSFVSELDQMADNHHTAANSLDPEFPVNDVQEDAMLIYDRYFSMQATDPLGFGDQIRVEVEGNICTVDGMPKSTAFERPRQIAATLLQNKYIPLFVESHHFTKILDGLYSTVEHMTVRYDCSQRSSTSQQHRQSNVSLPSVSNENSTPKGRVRSRSYDYDEDELEDMPEQQKYSTAVNKAKHRVKLNSLAKVDRLGRYKPLFDNSLCSTTSMDDYSSIYSAKDRIKSALDKYLYQTAAKESLAAEEVAELIIEDIQKKTATVNAARRQAQLHRKRP